MTNLQIEPDTVEGEVSQIVKQGMMRRSHLHDASDDLKSYVQTTVEKKAEGKVLWAKLMMEILKPQITEEAVRDTLDTAPAGVDDMITEFLRTYSSFHGRIDCEELNTILAWVSCASRPSTLAELNAVLGRTLGKRIRDTYAALITFHRDDGTSESSLKAEMSGQSLHFIPEATTVAFSHASMTDFFRKRSGKFTRQETGTAVGVNRQEAEFELLKTCLEVFVDPGAGSTLESSQALTQYAKTSWMDHVRGALVELSQTGPGQTQPVPTIEAGDQIVKFFFRFLTDEAVVRKWSHGVPWQFFTEENAVSVVTCIGMLLQQARGYLPKEILEWWAIMYQRPQEVFSKVALVNATESLQGEWYPLQSLSVVAQILALLEGSKTLDNLLEDGNLSLDLISKSIVWLPFLRDAAWHRNVAICYRKSGHSKQAVEHYENALSLDPELLAARSGLALTYKAQGDYTKAIDLELINVVILRQRLSAMDQNDQGHFDALEELSISYETITNSYRLLKDDAAALRYWREAVETTAIKDENVRAYLAALATSTDSSRWEEVIRLLRMLDNSTDSRGQNRLTKHIHRKRWPNEVSPDFFYMAATAAKQTNCLPWLIKAYESVLCAASTKSHMDVLFLKLGLAKLLARYQHDYHTAEPLIEEIGSIASIQHDPCIPGLEDCKREIAREFCHIAMRKTLEGKFKEDGSIYVQRVSDMVDSGITPEGLAEKIKFREISQIHLAHLHCITGSFEAARRTIRPYIVRCCSMAREEEFAKAAGIQGLVECLLALGRVDEARGLIEYAYMENGWFCNMCQRQVHAPQSASICLHCFDGVCETCVGVLKGEPGRAGFCVAGHDLLHFGGDSKSDKAFFNCVEMKVDECVACIEAE